MHAYFDLTLRAYRVLLQESIIPSIQDGGRSTQKWYCLTSRLLRVQRLFYFASLYLFGVQTPQIHKPVIIIVDISTKINDVKCHKKMLDTLGYEVLEEVFSEATLIPPGLGIRRVTNLRSSNKRLDFEYLRLILPGLD